MPVRIDHVGSTSVPGLAAKDIIDVQVTVADLDDPRLAPAFEQLGATATDITSDHLPPGHPSTRVNLRAGRTGSPNHRYALLFRD